MEPSDYILMSLQDTLESKRAEGPFQKTIVNSSYAQLQAQPLHISRYISNAVIEFLHWFCHD